jgi:uncharacterized membrane protein YebE (DUF533 family)
MMFNAKDLVGTLMQNVLTDSSQNRIEHALGDRGLGQAGGALAQLFGGTPGGGSGTGTGGMLGGLADMVKSMFSGTGPAGGSGNPLAVGGLGALAGALLGGGKGATRGALGGGAMALLGSLAVAALQNLSRQAASSASAAQPAELPLGLRTPVNEAEESELESVAMVILKAMINAAKADGQIDDAERQRILGKLEASGTDAEAREFVHAEMQKPLDIDALAREVSNPQIAVQAYAASLLAIKVDTPAERDYLSRLAQRLGLDAETVQQLHTTLGVA